MEQPVRWTVRVSRDTDVAVRMFLAQRGMKKGDLAKFIEEAVRWRVLELTSAQASKIKQGASARKVAEASRAKRRNAP